MEEKDETWESSPSWQRRIKDIEAGLERNKAWEQLAKDMNVVVNRTFAPLNVLCVAYGEWQCIDYHPPFHLEVNPNKVIFSVNIKCGKEETPKYPLKCSSDCYVGQFIVESPEDWETHADKFIERKNDIEELIRNIRL